MTNNTFTPTKLHNDALSCAGPEAILMVKSAVQRYGFDEAKKQFAEMIVANNQELDLEALQIFMEAIVHMVTVVKAKTPMADPSLN